MKPRNAGPSRAGALRQKLASVARQQWSEIGAAVTGLGRLQVGLMLVGASIVAWGGILMVQLLLDQTAPLLGVGGWWLGGPLVVDLIAVPVVVIVGVTIRRVVPSGWRRYVSAASALTVLLTLVAFPFLTGLGRRPDNASLLDRNYWAGYLAVLGLVWAAPLLARLVKAIRGDRRSLRNRRSRSRRLLT